jgi:hypothetical protein
MFERQRGPEHGDNEHVGKGSDNFALFFIERVLNVGHRMSWIFSGRNSSGLSDSEVMNMATASLHVGKGPLFPIGRF